MAEEGGHADGPYSLGICSEIGRRVPTATVKAGSGKRGAVVETDAHQHLKRLALEYLRRRGGQALATEVRCPIARYRVDVAGYLDTDPEAGNGAGGRRPRRCEPRTVMIECKQTRADFLRDRRDADRLLDLRQELERMRRAIEERRIKVHEPHLRQSGSALFPELEDWDFGASRLRAYHRLLRRIRRLETQLYGETKFFTIARYRLADELYLAAPRGMIKRRELPRGWGLLECPRRRLGRAGPGVVLSASVDAPPQRSRADFRLRLLRNIAVAASRRTIPVMSPAPRRRQEKLRCLNPPRHAD